MRERRLYVWALPMFWMYFPIVNVCIGASFTFTCEALNHLLNKHEYSRRHIIFLLLLLNFPHTVYKLYIYTSILSKL